MNGCAAARSIYQDQVFNEAQRARLRAAKGERNTLIYGAARLKPRPFCACSSKEGRWRYEQLKIFMRYESQHERAYNACLGQLLALTKEKRSIDIGFEREKQLKVQATQRTQRHEITQKARQVDIDCKIIRTLRTSADNPEALHASRDVKTRYQAA